MKIFLVQRKFLHYLRVSQAEATERFSGGHGQRSLLNSSTVILQNPSVTVKLKVFLLMSRGPQVLRVFRRGPQTMKG